MIIKIIIETYDLNQENFFDPHLFCCKVNSGSHALKSEFCVTSHTAWVNFRGGGSEESSILN